ncbi:MAG: AraC family transcriptional regulator [Cyanobacteria bacterium P01_D01_bin.1]
MEIITKESLNEQSKADSASTEILHNINGFDAWTKYQGRWSQGEYRYVKLRSGLSLIVNDELIRRDVGFVNHHGDSGMITANFYLSGTHGVVSPSGIEGVPESYEEKAGKSYCFCLPDMDEIEQYIAGDRLRTVKLFMSPDFIRSFSSDSELLLPQLKPLLEGKNAPRFHLSAGELTPAMRTTIYQIVNASHQGTVQKMYLEGKALELAALQIVQLNERDSGKQTLVGGLKPANIERVHHAKEILIRSWINPPSLGALARQVGLNDCTLKRGFRQIFGTTVFRYLQSYRLEQAEQILASTDISVTEVARQVGYADTTAFARAFKRKFGMNPKAYQKTCR